jgi:hypothetical protein
MAIASTHGGAMKSSRYRGAATHGARIWQKGNIRPEHFVGKLTWLRRISNAVLLQAKRLIPLRVHDEWAGEATLCCNNAATKKAVVMFNDFVPRLALSRATV